MSTDLDDLIRRDDELYDFNAPKIEAQADGRQSLTGKLDVLAALPSSASPSIEAQADAETGEVTEQANSNTAASAPTGETKGDATEAGSVPNPQDPATLSSSIQPTASPDAVTAGPGQAAPDTASSPSKADTAKGAAKAADKPPSNEKEYVEATTIWIANLIDAEAGEKRWKDEKGVRNKANVGADARESLQEKLAAKCAEIRDADRS